MIRQLVGDCRETLPTLDVGSIQAAITSPPYYGLRDYGTPPLVWGQTCCDHPHDWGAEQRAPWANELPSARSETRRNNAFHESMGKTAGAFCQHVHQWDIALSRAQTGGLSQKQLTNSGSFHAGQPNALCPCGAWLGSLGLEPSPELYIEHIVECFRHVRRALRDDGVLWLNLGDSYAGSGKGPSNSLNRSNPHSHEAAETMKRGLNNLRDTPTQRIGPQEHTIGIGRVHGYKPKDLMLLPFRVALALQADGWTLRAHLPWLKRNCMPGSEKDRPTVSIESVFLFSKSRRYFWDYDAVKREAARKSSDNKIRFVAAEGARSRTNSHLGSSVPWESDGSGRNWRTGDLFFDSWQGLLVDEDGDPLAFVVNPKGFSGAHFATFPTRLIEPMVKASTRPGDTVLDPFGGSGTVGLVADRMDRNAVLCDLKTDYADMAMDRVMGDAPMFTEVAAD